MIPAEAAIQKILEKVPRLGTELVATDACAGRILRQSVSAGRDAPPFDRVMMDGYAVAAESLPAGEWHIRGIALAGHEPPPLEDPADCIEVTTGCILPDGCDTVIPVEDCRIANRMMNLKKGSEVDPGQYIHAMGSDNKAGDRILGPGMRIGPPEMAVLATEGVSRVKVARHPRIGLVTTGDEVVNDDSVPQRTQIRGSHKLTLQALFSLFPQLVFMHRHCRDNRGDMREALSLYLEDVDILLITGGVSMGRKDIIPELLEELGVDKILHRVAQRPGKPLWFGTSGEKLVFGLPGNPISALICARRYVFPVIEKLMAADAEPALRVALANTVEPLQDMTWYVPVRQSSEGLLAEPYATSGSLQNLAGTNGFIELPPAGQSASTFNYFQWRSR